MGYMMHPFRRVNGNKVIISLPPTYPCPCGSNKVSSMCCLKTHGFFKEPTRVRIPGKKTQISNSDCYASLLCDCTDKLSREHFISESLLHELNKEGGLHVSGFRWQEAAKIDKLPPNALASKILCSRHNSALSVIDDVAIRLFSSFNEAGALGSGKKCMYLFSGIDVERWLLKILCGLLSARMINAEGIDNFELPKQWLDILFGFQTFLYGQGLYVCREIGRRFDGKLGVTTQLITSSGNPSGLILSFCGYELILSMAGLPTRIFQGKTYAYRPFELYAKGFGYEKSIVFSWPRKGDSGTISFQL